MARRIRVVEVGLVLPFWAVNALGILGLEVLVDHHLIPAALPARVKRAPGLSVLRLGHEPAVRALCTCNGFGLGEHVLVALEDLARAAHGLRHALRFTVVHGVLVRLVSTFAALEVRTGGTWGAHVLAWIAARHDIAKFRSCRLRKFVNAVAILALVVRSRGGCLVNVLSSSARSDPSAFTVFFVGLRVAFELVVAADGRGGAGPVLGC